MDVLVDVLRGGQLGDARLGLLVRHLGSSRGEVLIALIGVSQNKNTNKKSEAIQVT